ncbi:MAG: hypothetical protein KC657_06670 [Myxococcales bacterium]|nr:hypothetical protein [Myxococcales bacterium]
MTSWDARAFARAIGATCVAFAIGWLVTAASDEGALTVGARAGRTVPLLPLFAAVGTAIAIGSRRAREELRALAALGRHPARTAAFVTAGAALPAAVAALVLVATPHADVSAFYPAPDHGDAFVATRSGYVSPSLGVEVRASGEIDVGPAPDGERGVSLPAHARGAAALSLVVAALALAALAAAVVLSTPFDEDRFAQRRRVSRAVGVAAGVALATTLAFQSAAARASSAWLTTVPALALMAWLFTRYRRGHA